jgi:hypothetical protein
MDERAAMTRHSRSGATLAAVALFAAACGSGSSSTPQAPSSAAASLAPIERWPLPEDPMGLARKAGLEPLRIESLQFHVHAHLDVFEDGRPIVIPAGIGIDITDPGVKRFEDPVGYGGIQQPCADPCISPLHTHDSNGVIHTESPTPTPNTLGQFLIEWEVVLPDDAKVYIDGEEFSGDVASIELADRREIAIVIGEPPSPIPSRFPPGVE